MSPSVFMYTRATRETSDSGGLSLTNRRDELGRDEMRCAWMIGKNIDDHFTVFDSTRGDSLSKYKFLALIMNARTENEFSGSARTFDAPARKCARNLLHVLLRVTAVHTHGVQFHQFAGVVLVDAAQRCGLKLSR